MRFLDGATFWVGVADMVDSVPRVTTCQLCGSFFWLVKAVLPKPKLTQIDNGF